MGKRLPTLDELERLLATPGLGGMLMPHASAARAIVEDDQIATVLAKTAMAVIANKAANDLKRGKSEWLWSYQGPVDGITRPFCQKLVGKAFSFEQVLALDNGQIPDVASSCGGWACRHRWVIVGKDWLKDFDLKRGKDADVEKANAAAKKPWQPDDYCEN